MGIGAAPQHDRCGADQRDPARNTGRHERADRGQHFAHPQQEDGHGEDRADDEPPGHVGELRRGRVVEGDGHRLEGHATQRTVAGTVLEDLRVHRAGVDRVGIVGDLAGRRVQTVVSAELDAGDHIGQWDGTDFNGRVVSSGTYLYRLETPQRTFVQKMQLVK